MRTFLLAAAMLSMLAVWSAAYAKSCTRLDGDRTFLAQAAPSERRVAFVAGVSAYETLPTVAQSTRDARVFGARLQQLGFDVVLSTDADASAFQACFASYIAGATGAKVQIFYFSGHGVQAGAGNYLAGRDARTAGSRGFVPLATVIDGMAPVGGARLVILDASRRHGLAGQAIGFPLGDDTVRVGLSPEEMRSATATGGADQLVALGASPNTEADEPGRLSLFTDALLDSIGAPGYSIQRVLAEAARAVGERTNFARAPWSRSSLTADVFLNGRLDAAALRAASEAYAGEAERLAQGERGNSDRALAAALKGLPPSAPADEPAFAAARRAYQIAARTVLVRLPMPRGDGEGTALVDASAQRIAVLRGLSLTLWAPRGPRKITEITLAGDNAIVDARGRSSSRPLIVFAPDGRHLAVFNPGAKQVVVLDAQTGAVMGRVSSFATRAPSDLALANGGRRVLIHNSFQAALYDVGVATGALFDLASRQEGEGDEFFIPALSPDGREIALLADATFGGGAGRGFTVPRAQQGARSAALHRYSVEAARFTWSGGTIPVQSSAYVEVSYAPKGDFILCTESEGVAVNLRVFATAAPMTMISGRLENRVDSIAPDGRFAAVRETVYAIPAMTVVDVRTLAAPPVVHRVFGSDGGEFDFRIPGWPPAAPMDAAALETARMSLPQTLAEEVAAQRVRYTRLAPAEK